jgi:hypothetical protein
MNNELYMTRIFVSPLGDVAIAPCRSASTG